MALDLTNAEGGLDREKVNAEVRKVFLRHWPGGDYENNEMLPAIIDLVGEVIEAAGGAPREYGEGTGVAG
jgi:hypothetical protein